MIRGIRAVIIFVVPVVLRVVRWIINRVTQAIRPINKNPTKQADKLTRADKKKLKKEIDYIETSTGTKATQKERQAIIKKFQSKKKKKKQTEKETG